MLLIVVVTPHPPVARADPTIPPVWDIVADDFESGSLDAWSTVSASDLSLAPGGGFTHTASVGLLVGGARVYLPLVLRGYP